VTTAAQRRAYKWAVFQSAAAPFAIILAGALIIMIISCIILT
jgi:hypothetical protein